MMLADEPVARRVGKDLAHHGAKRVLHQKVVADEIGRHEEWVRAVMQDLADHPGHCNLAAKTRGQHGDEVEASVARRLRTPPRSANP